MVLHKASCYSVTRTTDQMSEDPFTGSAYIKVCSEDPDALPMQIEDHDNLSQSGHPLPSIPVREASAVVRNRHFWGILSALTGCHLSTSIAPQWDGVSRGPSTCCTSGQTSRKGCSGEPSGVADQSAARMSAPFLAATAQKCERWSFEAFSHPSSNLISHRNVLTTRYKWRVRPSEANVMQGAAGR